MTKNPKISLLIPIYNVKEQYLKECLDSILKQTYQDFEILLLNDGTKNENMEKFLSSFHDKRILYRKNATNQGISKSRNILMDWARGDYFAVMDQDDIALPKRFEKQLAFMESHPEVGICGSDYKRFGYWKKNGIISHQGTPEEISAGLFFKCMIHHPSAFIRASVIRENQIRYDSNYISANDRHLYLDIMRYAKLANIPEVLMLYRIHPNMTSRQKQVSIRNEQNLLRNDMLSLMKINLSQSELEILHNYVTKGRCRIKDRNTLIKVEHVLSTLNQGNNVSQFFQPEAFGKLCAKYLVKRCLNASVYGRISSKDILANTTLPLQKVKIPMILNILNIILRQNTH